MKKTLIATITIAVLGMIVSANAQKIKFGAKAGLNINTLSKNEDHVYENYSSLVSFHVGAVAEITISEKFSFQPELIYSAQGAKVKFSSDNNEGTFKLNYLNVPLLAKYYVVDAFSVEVGPKIGFLLSAKQIFDSNSEDYKDLLKTFDFGLNFGVGYKLDTGLNFGARYNLGFSNILDKALYGEENSLHTIKNNVLQISVGYLF